MMVNYSEWHTERAPQGKKVNSVEETSSLSDKIDTIMAMLVSDSAHVDPNNVPLASLVAQEEHVDVNFLEIIISTIMLTSTEPVRCYGTTLNQMINLSRNSLEFKCHG
jgi:hypothetical protein